jgi:glutamine synthetase
MVDAIPYYKSEKTVALFEKMNVMSKVELEARAEVMYELYAKYINIEAKVMVDMVNKQILPAVLSYEGSLAREAADIARSSIEPTVQKDMIGKIAEKAADLKSATEALTEKLAKAATLADDVPAWARFYHDEIFMSFDTVRKPVDELEEMVSRDKWPMPTYRELLFEI